MPNASEPMIKLEPGGQAPVLSYNVPEPTTYTGVNYIELDYPLEYFKSSASETPQKTLRKSIAFLDRSMIKDRVVSAMKVGFYDPDLFTKAKMSSAAIRAVEKPNPGLVVTSAEPVSHVLKNLDPDIVSAHIQAGEQLSLYKTMFGEFSLKFVPEPATARPRLLLVETYRLSSYLGNYGAGRTIKTFSLLPGEKTKISVKTYAKRETDAKSASSIFDSFTQESADDFEKSLENEQSNKEKYEETFAYHAEAEASCSWGFGSAKVSGGVKGGTDSAREESAKNISKASEKHAAKASAKRDVQVNTSFEVKEQTGEETSIEREIQNINVSRTLNFVFRQMNQEFITLLYLVDARVAFFNGFNYREASLYELDSLLEEVLADQAKRDEVKKDIIDELANVYDHEDNHQSFVEEKAIDIKDKNGNVLYTHVYLRARKDIRSEYTPDPGRQGLKIVVPGIILSARKHVLRTDGIIVEALLGQGDALDSYSNGLQGQAVRNKELANSLLENEIQKGQLAMKLVTEGNASAADIFSKVYPAPQVCHERREDEGGHGSP